jgi:protein associated with RNAse G/E
LEEERSDVTLEPATITVRACKYDGSEHRRWPATILKRDGSLLVLDGKFEEEIQHDLLGTIAAGTTSIEYYWLDRWYNIFRFIEPSGELRNYYCNVNVPPTFDGQILSYVDLDTDILIEPDFSYRVLDLDEFEQNAARYGYPLEVRQNAEAALRALINLIEKRAFPFSE